MRRAIFKFLFSICCAAIAAPAAHAQITYIGNNGQGPVSCTTLYVGGSNCSPTTSFDQAAGDTIVVATNTFPSSLTVTIQDTAGNVYLPIFAGSGITLTGGVTGQMWYAANCLGNATNQIVANYSAGGTFDGIAAWDLENVNTLDVSSFGTGGPTAGAGSANVAAFSTNFIRESVIIFAWESGSFGTFTPASTGYTLDFSYLDDNNQQAGGAHAVVTSLQSSITPGIAFPVPGGMWYYGALAAAFYQAFPVCQMRARAECASGL